MSPWSARPCARILLLKDELTGCSLFISKRLRRRRILGAVGTRTHLTAAPSAPAPRAPLETPLSRTLTSLGVCTARALAAFRGQWALTLHPANKRVARSCGERRLLARRYARVMADAQGSQPACRCAATDHQLFCHTILHIGAGARRCDNDRRRLACGGQLCQTACNSVLRP